MCDVSKIMNKAMLKIAKKIKKEAKLPPSVDRWVVLHTYSVKKEIKVEYANNYVGTLELTLNGGGYRTVYYLAEELRNMILKYACTLDLTKAISDKKI